MSTYHALVEGGVVIDYGGLPPGARRQDNDEWVLGLQECDDPTLVAATGWLPVVEIYQPLGPDQHYELPIFTVFPDHVDATYAPIDDDPPAINRRQIMFDVSAAMVQLENIVNDGPIIPGGAGLPAIRIAVLDLQNNIQLEALLLRKIIRTIIGDYTGAD